VFMRLLEQAAAPSGFHIDRDCVEAPLRRWRRHARRRYGLFNAIDVMKDLAALHRRSRAAAPHPSKKDP